MPRGERLSALQFRDFKLFFFSQLISLSGTWMQSVAQLWLVYSLTKSPLYLGIVVAHAQESRITPSGGEIHPGLSG